MINEADNKVTVTDKNGRTFKIRKLLPLDRMRIFEAIGPELSENMQYLAYASLAAAVAEIDAVAYSFPHNKKDIELVVHVLNEEGIEAVATGYRDNFSAGESGDMDKIKN